MRWKLLAAYTMLLWWPTMVAGILGASVALLGHRPLGSFSILVVIVVTAIVLTVRLQDWSRTVIDQNRRERMKMRRGKKWQYAPR